MLKSGIMYQSLPLVRYVTLCKTNEKMNILLSIIGIEPDPSRARLVLSSN